MYLGGSDLLQDNASSDKMRPGWDWFGSGLDKYGHRVHDFA
jgi:hypothetical protein